MPDFIIQPVAGEPMLLGFDDDDAIQTTVDLWVAISRGGRPLYATTPSGAVIEVFFPDPERGIVSVARKDDA